MPLYRFTCPEGHTTDQHRPVARYVEWIKCKHATNSSPCGKRAFITISTRLEVNTFKPYVEEHMTGRPILVESKQQRDSLCAKHGVTYDSAKYVKRAPEKAAVEDLDFGKVMSTIERGKLDDGTPIEQPVVDTQTDD